MADERIQAECRPSESDMIQVPERPKEFEDILQRLTELEKQMEDMILNYVLLRTD